MTTTEMKTLVCPGPPEHEFQIPKGRGRPPRYCDEHKPNQQKQKSEEKEVSEPATRARPRPGNKQSSESETPASRPRPRAPRISPNEPHPGDAPVDVDGPPATMNDKGKIERSDAPEPDATRRRLPPPGRPDVGSRAKGAQAAERAAAASETDVWPRGLDGAPMTRIEFSVSELIPTGQFANVTIGPVRVTSFVDLNRGNEDMPYYTEQEKDTITKAANELADMMERDVIGVQRNLVLESLQSDDSK